MRGTLATAVAYGGTTYDFAYTKKHGTTLFYSFVGAIQRGTSSSAPTDNYYRLERVVDRNGNELQYAYGVSGQPTLVSGVSDPTESTRSIAFGYDNTADGWRLTSVTDPLSRTHDYHYTNGLLASVEKPAVADPDAPSTLVRPTVGFTYEVTAVEPRLVMKTSGGDPWNSKSLINWVLPSTITEARGHTTSFTYDFRYTPTAIGVEDSVATDFWENKPRVTSMTTVDGTAYVDEPSRTLLTATTTFTDTRGITTTYNFGSGSAGQIVPAPNDLGFGLVIDQFSRAVDVADADANSSTKTVTFYYGGGLAGNLSEVVDMSGNAVRFEYDSGEIGDAFNAQPYGSYFASYYQIFGQPARSILDFGGLALTTEYRYDVTFNKLVKQIDPAGKITEYTIDSKGNRTEVIEGSGTSVEATTTYGYDSRGFITSETDADGRVKEYVANDFGNLEYTVVKGLSGEDLTPLESTSPYSSVDPDGKYLVTRRIADVMDRTLTESDGRGNVTEYAYDNWDRNLSVELPEVLDPSWNPLSVLPAVLVTAANLFRYDYNSNVVREQDQNGNVTTTTYDALNRKTETRRRIDNPASDSANDIVSQWSYDEVGLVATSTDPLGRVTSLDYDALLRLIKTTLPQVTVVADPSSTSASPATTTEQYTVKQYYGTNSGSGAFTFGGFNPTRIVNARGYATDTQYDSAYRAVKTIQRKDGWQSLASTDAERAGEPTTTTQYNAASKPIVITTLNEDRNNVSADRPMYTFYDNRHRPTVSVLDFDGDGVGITAGTFVNDASSFTGDSDDFINRIAYDGAGNAIAATDAEGRTTENTYDGANRPIEVQMPAVAVYLPDGGGLTTGYIPTVTTAYDANSNAVLSIDANGNKTASTYDARNRLLTTVLDLDDDDSFEATHGPSADDIVTRWGYDLAGNAIYSIDPNGNRTDSTYDRADRLITVTGAAVADAENGNVMTRPVTATNYDKASNVIVVTDPRGLITTTLYDELNRPRIVTANADAIIGSADRLRTESRYDANGNVVALVMHNRVDSVDRPQVTIYTFDAFDRQTTETLPDVGDSQVRQSSVIYSRAGDVLTATDAKSQSVQTDYDRAGRGVETRLIRADTTTEETRASTFDKVGNLLSRSDRHGVTSHTYDALNRQVTEERETTTAGIADDYRVESFFDPNGNRTQVIYPAADGDPDGRVLVSVYDRANRMVEMRDGSRITTFGYDAAGNRLSHLVPNGVLTTATFDSANRVTTMASVTNNGTGSTIHSLTYAYDLASNRRSSVETISGHGTRNIDWTYDGLYRLTGEGWTGPQARSYAYTYDPAGNRLTKVEDATASGGSVSTTTNVYDDLNQIVTSTTGADTTTYSHDLNGNRISKTVNASTTTYEFDVSDRLIAATDGSATIFEAAYDARTRRLSKTEGSDTTLFRYDGGTNFQELTPGVDAGDPADNVLNTQLIRAGGLGGGIGSVLYSDKSMAPTAGPVEHFVYNAVGHTVALTDDAAAVTQSSLYEAFGDTVAQAGTGSDNNRLANTKERDASLGLDDHGFRYYDPQTGRYVTRDPIGYGDGLNAYHSVGNNPINQVDPLGLQGQSDLVADAAAASRRAMVSNAGCMVCHGTGLAQGWARLEDLSPTIQARVMMYAGDKPQYWQRWGEAYWEAPGAYMSAMQAVGDWSDGVQSDVNSYTLQNNWNPVLSVAVAGAVAIVFAAMAEAVDPTNYIPGGRAVKGVANATEAAVDVGKLANKAADATRATQNAAEGVVKKVDDVVPEGGTYVLRDPATGEVARTGRSKELATREQAHARSSETKDLDFEVDKRTDDYAQQRGREHILYERHPEAMKENGGLNKIKAIRDNHANKGLYSTTTGTTRSLSTGNRLGERARCNAFEASRRPPARISRSRSNAIRCSRLRLVRTR